MSSWFSSESELPDDPALVSTFRAEIEDEPTSAVLAVPRSVDPELEAYVERARDPSLIPGIYNYCHHRCQQCPFTGRCLSFREEQQDAHDHPERSLTDHMEANFTRAAALMKAWCEQRGIDVETIQESAEPDEAATTQTDRDESVDDDPVQELAWQYSSEAYDIVAPLANLSRFHAWAPAVGAAIDTIAWYSGLIPAKIGRALHGAADEDRLDDLVQNDWNGSAKVARLAIAESIDAWRTLFEAGDTPVDASIRRTAGLLEQIDRTLAARFPLAMEFVRPGFDEPEVAAGALTRLAPFEPRHRTMRRRLQSWSWRLRRRVLHSIKGKSRTSAPCSAGVQEKGPNVFQRPGLKE